MFDDSGDLEGLAAAAYALCWTQSWYSTDRARAIAEAERTLERLKGVTSVSKCRLLYIHALLCNVSGDLEGQQASLEEARRAHRSLEDADLDLMALDAETWIHWHLMEVRECSESAELAIRLCRSAGDRRLQSNFECVQAFASLFLGRRTHSSLIMDDARRPADHIGHYTDSMRRFMLDMLSAYRALYDGDLDAADRAAQASIAYGTKRRIPWVYHSYYLRGAIAVYRNSAVEALESMRRAVDLETPSAWSGLSHAWLFWALAHTGDPEARTYLRQHRPPLPTLGRPSFCGAWGSLAVVVEGLAWLGERDELARLDVYADALVATGVTCHGSALFRTVAGTTAAASGDWGRAQAHYEAALEQSASAPYRHAEPQVRHWYAEMLRDRDATGDRERARALLQEAIASYAALGMTAFEHRARERLATL